MNNPIIILGNTPFAEMIKYYIESYTLSTVCAFAVDKNYLTQNYLSNLPVVPLTDITYSYPPQHYDFVIAIGYSHMNNIRKEKILFLKKCGYNLPNLIHPSVNMETCKIGCGNIILENCNLGYHSKIGDGNILWNGCNISHDTFIGNYNYLSPSVALAGRTTIGNNCFLGINSCTCNDITIRDYSLVGANCYINSSTNKYSVYLSPPPSILTNKNSLDINF